MGRFCIQSGITVGITIFTTGSLRSDSGPKLTLKTFRAMLANPAECRCSFAWGNLNQYCNQKKLCCWKDIAVNVTVFTFGCCLAQQCTSPGWFKVPRVISTEGVGTSWPEVQTPWITTWCWIFSCSRAMIPCCVSRASLQSFDFLYCDILVIHY